LFLLEWMFSDSIFCLIFFGCDFSVHAILCLQLADGV